MDQPSPAHSVGQPPSLYRPDWYPDPTNRFEYRYHNGQTWTGDVSVNGNRFLDPLPLERPTPPRTPTAGQAVAAFVLGLGSLLLGWVPFLCVLGVAAAVLAIIFGIGALRAERRQPVEGRRGHGLAVAGLVLAPLGLIAAGFGFWLTVLVFRAVDEFANIGPYLTAPTSCAVEDGVPVFRGTITNLSTKTRSYRLTAEFTRTGTDNVVARESVAIDDVQSGDTTAWSVRAVIPTRYENGDIRCSVHDVTGPLPFGIS